MIERRLGFVALLLFVLTVTPVAADAQAGKVYRLGMLSPGARPAAAVAMSSTLFAPILGEMGYVEGRNLVIERRYAEGKLDRLPGLAQELVQLRVDALIAASPPAVQAAREATKKIPIVMLVAYSDPVELGFVASFARPGGNVTGVALGAEPTIAGKRLELLKELVPRATRIAVLAAADAESRTQVRWAQTAASALGVKLVVVEVRDAGYDRAFATMMAEGANALFVVASPVLATDRGRVIQLAAKHRLPAIYDWREHVEEGGLMAYGGSLSGFTRRAAMYVDRIFKGANPADLPVERAITYDLVINRKTAKELGLSVPSSLLLRATDVIE